MVGQYTEVRCRTVLTNLSRRLRQRSLVRLTSH